MRSAAASSSERLPPRSSTPEKRHGRRGRGAGPQVIVLTVAAVYLALLLTARPAREHPIFENLPRDRPAVIAHRGGAGIAPENTTAAFRKARAVGADLLEMDVRSTADGIPVVIHDDTVDRTTNGEGPVSSFRLAELRDLDAGYRFAPPEDPEQRPYRGAGTSVPTLREVFERFPEAPMIVEIKEDDPGLADAVVGLLKEYRRSDRTVLASFHHGILERVRRSSPETATHGTDREVARLLLASWLFSGGLVAPRYEALFVPPKSGPIPVLTRRFVAAARGRNLFVAGWTINDPQQMSALAARGVDGLITDRPELALEILSP